MRTLFPLAVVGLVLVALPGAAVFAADLLGYEAQTNAWLEGRFGVSHRVALALPAALVLFCVPPLIVLLYFLRLRRKPIAVSSTYLWKKSVEDLHVNRLMQLLRRNILLLLQLLAVLAVIYAALGPRLHGTLAGGRHYILLIDNSASMSATDLAGGRLAWAKAEAIKEIDAATDTDFGMVIAFNSTAEIRQSYTNNRAELKAAVLGIDPTEKPTRIDEALGLAASLANPLRSTEDAAAAPANPEPGKERTYVSNEGMQADVHLYSDGRFPSPEFALANLSMTYHTPPVTGGGGADNVSIARVDAERGWFDLGLSADDRDPADPDIKTGDPRREDPTRLTVVVTVRNYRPSATPVTLSLQLYEADAADPSRSYVKTVKGVAPKAELKDRDRLVPFYLPDVPENADLTVRVRVEKANDVFPLDDQGWVVMGIVRKAKVLVLSPDGNFLLRTFLDLSSTKKLAEVTYLKPDALTDPAQYLTPAREGRFDLVVFDRCGPAADDQMPAANTLFIGHPPPPYTGLGTPGPLAVSPATGPVVQGWDDKHPLMRNLSALYDVGIDDAFRLPSLPPGTRKLMEADRGHVLIAAIPRQAFTDVVMTFPLLAGDGRVNTRWPLEPSFVLFLRNSLFALGNVRDAAAEDVTLPGQEKLLRPGGTAKLRVRLPDGTLKDMDRGPRPDFLFTDTNTVGVYTASWDDQSRRFAVNLFPSADHDESDLAPAGEVKIGEKTITAGEPRKQPRDLWKIAVVVGLLVLAGEWWVYNRRVQI